MIKKIAAVFLLLFLGSVSLLSAEEYKNLGFRKDVSKELKQKCSMCDEFLDVKWIDKNKLIGKLKADQYANGKKKGVQYLLIHIKKPQTNGMLDRGDFVFFKITKENYYDKTFEQFLQGATLAYRDGRCCMFNIYIENNSLEKSFKLFNLIAIPSEFSAEDSFAFFSKNICLLYPDEQTAFIVETKQPFKNENLTQEETQVYDRILDFIHKKCKQISIELTESTKKQFICYDGNMENSAKYSSMLDVDFNGYEDYIFEFMIGGSLSEQRQFIYLAKNDSYEFKDITECFYDGKSHFSKVLYFVPEEKSFYIGKCNLTKIIKGGK